MILEDICDVYSGYAIKQFNEDKIGVPVIKIGNILMDGTIELEDCQYTTEKVNQKYYSEYQDIYIALSGATTGKIGILKRQEKFIVNQRVGIVRKKDNNIPIEFIKYFLFHHTDRIFKEAAGCAQPNISPKQIGKYKVPIIDDSRMKYVVEILDSLTRIINKRKRQLNYLDELIKARFVEMFGSIYNNEYGYNIKTLQDVCEPIKDGTHQTPIYTENIEKGFKFLSSKDVVSGKIDWSKVKYIPKELHEELYSRIKPQRGDLLLAKNGTTGVAAIVETDEVFDIYVSLAILRPVDINSVYLWGAVNSMETKRQFDGALKGIGVPNLHLGEIKKTKIVVPPIQIQAEFEQFVYQVNKSKFEVQKALDKAQLLFDSLMQKYFG